MLKITNLSKAFGGQPVLTGVSFQINPGERVGLIGRNGSGKTTLLRLILGEEDADTGTIALTPGETLGYLAQDLQLNADSTLHDELVSVFDRLLAVEVEQRAVEASIAAATEEDVLLALIERHDALAGEFERLGGYTVEAEVGKVMAGLGFRPDDRDKRVGAFSGGWQMRIGLGKLLLRAPGVLLLDEPTNHLDLAAVEWLAEYLRLYRGSIFMVSHDRWLLDRVCNRILELENRVVVAWPGNYTDYLRQKGERLETQAAAYGRQQAYLARQEAFIARFRAKPSKTRATQSREKLLDKMERIDAPAAPQRRLAFRFPACPPSGREAMILRQVAKGYAGTPVFAGVTLTIERGDRVALVGPNGAGKTTLLRLLAREERPDRGSVTWGHNVRVAYFTQHQAESLDSSRTVLAEINSVAPDDWSQTDRRSLLARFLFREDEVHKPVAVLSGGERSRVALAKLLLRPTNVLLLDEPTNHLDIPAQEVLEEALSHYEGAFVIATHDRFLLDRVTNKVIEVGAGGVTVHRYGYGEFVGRRANGKALVATAGGVESSRRRGRPGAPGGAGARSTPTVPAGRSAAAGSRAAGQVRSALRNTEQEIDVLERRSDELAQRLADPELYGRSADYRLTLQEHDEVSATLRSLEQRWEVLAREAEAMG